MFLHMMVAPLNKGTNRRRCRVEDCDLVLLNNLPKAAFIGMIGSALVHEDRRAGGQRSVHDIAMSRDPTDVRRAPKNVIVAMIEHPLECFFDVQIVASRGVLDSLRFTGRTTRIKNVERRLTVQRSGWALCDRLAH